MRKHGLFVEFCCSDNSALKRVTEQLGIAYFGVTKSTVNLDDEEAFEQVLEWLQVEVTGSMWSCAFVGLGASHCMVTMAKHGIG